MADYDDEPGDDVRDEPAPGFPVVVRVAGVIWILFGLLGLVGTVVQLAQAGAARAAGAAPGPAATAPCCGLLLAVAFLLVGYQTVAGKAKDTLGNGVGSIGIGLLYYAIAGLLAAFVPRPAGPNASAVVTLVILGGLGTLLVLAGGLALAGRTAYRDWRRAAGHDRPARRPRRNPDDE